jgi:hypothetical protein
MMQWCGFSVSWPLQPVTSFLFDFWKWDLFPLGQGSQHKTKENQEELFFFIYWIFGS